ncbi:MAG: fibronectin type III domain-containing protein [Lachnospiraceae bacterium]|nr:fibronectin type III domain-containing protein [Lachnospiraceae bacterium]
MATLNYNWQKLGEAYVGDTNGATYVSIWARITSQEISNNRSYVEYAVDGSHPSWVYDMQGYAEVQGTGTSGAGATVQRIDGTQTLATVGGWVNHNAYGDASISCSGYLSLPNWGLAATAYGSASLPRIPRYATANQSVLSKTETSITMRWSSDSTVDYIWYSKNGGTSWTGIDVADGTSGNYTISGLTAGTTYSIKTRVRRKDSQLTTDSSALSVATYAYPYANSMPNFMLGSSVTIGLYNPLKRSVTVEVLSITNEVVATFSTTAASVAGVNDTTAVDKLYQSTQSAASARYSVKVTYGSAVSSRQGGIYSVNTTVVSPDIDVVFYEDINETTLELTENSQDIVRNYSQVRYAATGLTAKKYASVASCVVTVNGNNYTLTLSGSSASGGGAVINSAQNVNATFTVTDSRGLKTSKTIQIHMLDVFNPTAVISLKRHDNFYTPCDLKVDAGFPSINGNNQITIEYVAKCEDETVADVTGTVRDNVTSVVNLDNSYSWNMTITLTDSLGETSTYHADISRGMPIIYFDKLNSRVGINGFPTCALDIHTNGTDEDIKINNITLKEYLANSVLDKFFPVGCQIGTFDVNFNPNTAWGGTWVKLTDGRVLIPTTATPHTLGGSSTSGSHTLTSAESGLQSHQHSVCIGSASYPAIALAANSGSTSNRYILAAGSQSQYTGIYAAPQTAKNATSGHTHNNINPLNHAYIVWYRTV